MKLYYSPGACSLSANIVLREAGLPFSLEKVDLKTKRTASDQDYTRINPKGYVPTLQFDDGTVLTEAPVILQWIADQVPEKHLAPAPGTMERYHLMEWLNFISTEIHKAFSPLFNPATVEATKQSFKDAIGRRFDLVQRQLGSRSFLTGNHFTVADAYLFTLLGWGQWTDIDVGRWPQLAAYAARIAERPKVREAMVAEKLIKA